MFGSNKLFGLDIGNGTIKSCKLSVRGKAAKLNKISFVKMDKSVYKNGEILNPNLLVNYIEASAKEIKIKKAAIGVSGSSVMVKKITIPKMDVAVLPEQVRWEAEQYIPYNIDEVNIDYIILENKDTMDTMDLLLIAAQQSRILQYVNVFSDSKIKVKLVDVSSFALANCFMFNYPQAKGSTVGLIDIGAFFTHFVVLHKGEVVFCRDIPSGGGVFDEGLAKNLGIPEEEALQIKESGESMPDIAVDTLKSLGKQYSKQLVGAVEFFTEITKEILLEKFYLTGGASLTPGLLELLAEHLNKPVEFMDVLQKITPSSRVLKEVNEKDLQYKAAVTIGLALRNLGDA